INLLDEGIGNLPLNVLAENVNTVERDKKWKAEKNPTHSPRFHQISSFTLSQTQTLVPKFAPSFVATRMATHLLPSPASSPLIMSPACMTVHLKPLSCCVGCFFVHLRPPKCRLHCYMVLARVIGRDCHLKASAKVMSPVLGDQHLNNSLNPSVLSTEKINGSDPSLGSSDNSLNDADEFEKPLQELLAEVKTLVSNGKKTDAIDLLQANY
ncbi:hypothetical protein Droror1_Dr00018258, partial [Drosera rotundifolia]